MDLNKYPRYAFGDPAVKTFTGTAMFGGPGNKQIRFDYPVSSKENLMRIAKHKDPLWVPNSGSEFQTIMINDVITQKAYDGGERIFIMADFTRRETENWKFNDWWHTNWTFVVSAGGPMLTPGFFVCDDILKWREQVKFPNFDDWDFESYAKSFMEQEYDPERVLVTDIGLGATERFVSLMGGYTEALVAFATEPEACAEFFEAFIDHEIEYFDRIFEHLPLGMITYHDDWGNEKDTFFSPAMLEELLLKPTRRLIDHVHEKGVVFEFHTCGNIARFMPYFVDMGVEFLQLQSRCVDLDKIKKEYGDKIGFGSFVEGIGFGQEATAESVISAVRATIDRFGATGGLYLSAFFPGEELGWVGANEIYAYSREYYENER